MRDFGHGNWSAIAERYFSEDRRCRAPTSLKDRASTLGIDPDKYPTPRTFGKKRGRPRRTKAKIRSPKPVPHVMGTDDEDSC